MWLGEEAVKDAEGWVTMGAFTLHHSAMSEEQLKAFMEAVKADAGLQEKLNAAADADAVVAVAKEAGFLISAEELQRAQAEISEEALEGVAGGVVAAGPVCGPLGGGASAVAKPGNYRFPVG